MGSKLIPVSQEPRLLKDFLKENSHSYSSTNFQYKKRFFEENLNATLFSNKALSKFFVRAVKYLPFASIKPPSILPRSISRRLSNNSRRNNLHGTVDVKEEVSVKVKVKDILRWRSFRDLADEESPPLDFSSSPHHCTTVTTTTGSTSTTAVSSSRSSWCDSDFTVEDLPLWCSEEEEYAGEIEKGKKVLSLGGLDGESMTVQSKGEWPCEEKEQNSPVSIADFSLIQEDEESFSFFHQTPTYFKPKKMQTRGLFMSKKWIGKEEINGVEEKAKQLLNHAKATSKVESDEDVIILLDFFMEELSTSSKQKGVAFDCELLRVAKAWMSGEDDGSLEWKMVGKREFSVRDMERGVRWNKFEEDEQELGLEMENEVLNYLVDEILVDFLN